MFDFYYFFFFVEEKDVKRVEDKEVVKRDFSRCGEGHYQVVFFDSEHEAESLF